MSAVEGETYRGRTERKSDGMLSIKKRLIFGLFLSCDFSDAGSSAYVDSRGWCAGQTAKTAVFFGANYSVPFACWDQRDPLDADS